MTDGAPERRPRRDFQGEVDWATRVQAGSFVSETLISPGRVREETPSDGSTRRIEHHPGGHISASS
jgi:hypothetical protein